MSGGARDVSGVSRPGGLEPTARRTAFVKATASGPLNDGSEGICFMWHPSNDLSSLLSLAAAATRRSVVRDPVAGHRRCATAAETIPFLGGHAVAGRESDPVLVERLGRLAFERRKVALDEPIGVYVRGVEHSRLRTPDGSAVPVEWFSRSRGVGADAAGDQRSRCQRLVLEVPAGEGFVVGDLVDVATEERVRHGSQIAELVRVGLFLRVSRAGVVDSKAGIDRSGQPREGVDYEGILEIAGAG
jgi:hypothetical protein